MTPFHSVTSIAAPLDRVNVDTDQIIPKQFLKRIERTGFGQYLFFDWRYLEDGTTPNPDFELNAPSLAGAEILVANKNFGCGSSREHAPWSLLDYGFRALIAPSYADIFNNNCYKNGLLPIVLPETEIDKLFDEVKAFPGYKLVVDLAQQTVATANGSKLLHFEIDSFRKHCMINGLDDIGLTLQQADAIHHFEERHIARFPWLANTI